MRNARRPRSKRRCGGSWLCAGRSSGLRRLLSLATWPAPARPRRLCPSFRRSRLHRRGMLQQVADLRKPPARPPADPPPAPILRLRAQRREAPQSRAEGQATSRRPRRSRSCKVPAGGAWRGSSSPSSPTPRPQWPRPGCRPACAARSIGGARVRLSSCGGPPRCGYRRLREPAKHAEGSRGVVRGAIRISPRCSCPSPVWLWPAPSCRPCWSCGSQALRRGSSDMAAGSSAVVDTGRWCRSGLRLRVGCRASSTCAAPRRSSGASEWNMRRSGFARPSACRAGGAESWPGSSRESCSH
mmetsp:Transcript_85649/g.247271  ORF Transcript_85649/g.247271 Transcript_85649/m.247271 type:complete len:299 (+) Transcript_85649:200-1096(+)